MCTGECRIWTLHHRFQPIACLLLGFYGLAHPCNCVLAADSVAVQAESIQRWRRATKPLDGSCCTSRLQWNGCRRPHRLTFTAAASLYSSTAGGNSGQLLLCLVSRSAATVHATSTGCRLAVTVHGQQASYRCACQECLHVMHATGELHSVLLSISTVKLLSPMSSLCAQLSATWQLTAQLLCGRPPGFAARLHGPQTCSLCA
jgi:hypothetical protein